MKSLKITFPPDLSETSRCRVVLALRVAGYRSHCDGYSLFTVAPEHIAQVAILAAGYGSSISTISATILTALSAE
jgi:hypothetical protein